MSITLVYVTYGKDLPWLKYGLQSVEKFVKNYSEILIYYHDECHNELAEMLNSIPLKSIIRTIPVHYDYHGYIKQMIVKLTCWKDINTTHVMFVDSDCILNKPYDASLVLNKITWYYVTETEPGAKDAFDKWKFAVQRMTGLPMTKYYMANTFPFIAKKQTLEAAELFFVNKHKQTYDVFCMKELARLKINVGGGVLQYWPTIAQVFEEFEYLGWYAEHYTNDYEFYTGERRDQTSPIAQFWSHGGITEEIRKQIESILD